MDVYDKSIERLMEFAENEYYEGNFKAAVSEAWEVPELNVHHGGLLFRAVSPSGGTLDKRPDGNDCGCLVEVRNGALLCNGRPAYAWTDDLTLRIKADERLPKVAEDIEPEHLPIFAEWQRIIDKELGRTVPSLDD